MAPESVVSLVESETATVTLDGTGLVVRWAEAGPTAWRRVVDARALIRSGGDLLALGTRTAAALDPETLEPRGTTAIDGFAACRGADSGWTWRDDGPSLWVHDARGAHTVGVAAVPAGDALCTAARETAALAWFDGLDAIVVTSEGAELRSAWWADAPPRALSAGSWAVSTVEQAVVLSGRVCDVSDERSGLAVCGETPTDRVAAYTTEGARPAIAAHVGPGLLVLAGSSSWITLVFDRRTPVTIRFAADRVYAAFGAEAPAVLTCEADDRGVRIEARDPARGTTLAEAPLAACPDRVRVTPRGATIEQRGGRPLFYDRQARAFSDAAPEQQGPSIEVVEAWSPACGGIASSIVRRDARATVALLGPLCGRTSIADVVSDGALVGVAVCADDVPARILARDGRVLGTDAELDCSISPVSWAAAGTAPSPRALFDEEGFRVEGGTGTFQVQTPAAAFTVHTAGDAVVVAGADWLWANEAAWPRAFWSDPAAGGAVRSVRDPATARVWGAAELASALLDRAAPQPPTR